MKYNNSKRIIEILLVEDNPGDVRLTSEALKADDFPNNINVAWDGVEAIEFLRRKGRYSDSPRPDLILLDLNMPRKDGREVLDEIKTDADLKSIPVIVLTTSDEEQDILKTYMSYANCYITKPIELEKLLNVLKSMKNFWFNIAKLPSLKNIKKSN